ncbi:MAG TPA: hypothetical protein VLD65_08195 [Anaerolineales bacterium]|nr:hypothetical protein [Anaerolineales bacterium]
MSITSSWKQWISISILFVFISGCSLPPREFIIAGVVGNGDISLNDRLVVVFLDGNEVGRDVSHTGTFKPNDITTVGLFRVTVPNQHLVAQDEFSDPFQVHKREIYLWFDQKLPENQWNYIKYLTVQEDNMTDRKIAYSVYVFAGQITELPESIRSDKNRISVNNNGDGFIAVPIPTATPTSIPTQRVEEGWTVVAINGGETSAEYVYTLTQPYNNCTGNETLKAEFRKEHKFIHEIVTENTLSIDGSIKILDVVELGLIPKIESKYGYKEGEEDTVSILLQAEAKPGTIQTYYIDIQEIWEGGSVALRNRDGTETTMPFKVKVTGSYSIRAVTQVCE